VSKAEVALEELRYEDAYEIFERVERLGTGTLPETRRLFQRMAEISASVRQQELAIRQFQKLLAIAPAFQLADGAPELFQNALAEARRRTGPLEPLRATLVYDEKSRSLSVVIERDSLRLIGGISVSRKDDGSSIEQRRGSGNLGIQIPPSVEGELTAVLEDSFGNDILQLQSVAVVKQKIVPKKPPPLVESRKKRSLWKRPSLWVGSASLAVLGIGAGLGLSVSNRQDELDRIIDESQGFTLADAEAAEQRVRDRAKIANITFAIGGALAIGAAVTWFLESDTEEPEEPTLSVTVSDSSIGFTGRF